MEPDCCSSSLVLHVAVQSEEAEQARWRHACDPGPPVRNTCVQSEEAEQARWRHACDPGPPVRYIYVTDIVLPDSVEQSPELKQMEMNSTSEEEGRNADCVHDHMILDPIYHMDVHDDSCAKAAAFGHSTPHGQQQGDSMQQEYIGTGCLHTLGLSDSRDGAAHSAAHPLAPQAAAASLPVSPAPRSCLAGTIALQTPPETPVVVPVRSNKRKREEEGVIEQGTVSSKQHCRAVGWSSVCHDTVLSIFRVVLTVWLLHDMLYDKP